MMDSSSLGPEPSAALDRDSYEELFRSHEKFLWGLCYRMTGVAADADDLVQETFVRAMQHPPERKTDPWRPWLVRVAMNLSRDLLRRRRRQTYVGPWLPSPIETGGEAALLSYEPVLSGGQSTEGRYDLLESVSFAFLLALEALSPQQRAVLLLRDVFDYSVQETAQALALSEGNVKTTHHRARRCMAAYDRERRIPARALEEQTRQVLEQFLAALANRDAKALEDLLAGDVCALSDGGGEFLAALNPVVGRDRVIRLYLGLTGRRSLVNAETRRLNGLPAVVVSFADMPARQASRLVVRCDVNAEGRITALHTVLASRKLTAVRFD
jgi:RNA polymerase sigma factor (sigma-70 family)